MSETIDETEHHDALRETGFWGRRGAGCILYARSTGRYLIAHRSANVLEPETWGIWGGAVPTGMNQEESVRLEVLEETAYEGEVELHELCEFRDEVSGFRYQNYLGVIDDEFDPDLNWESQDARWFSEGEWPEPLHFGLRYLLANCPEPASILGKRAQKP